MHVRPVDAERPAYGGAELPLTQLILTWKDLDAVHLIERALDGHPQTQGKVVDVDPTVFCWKGFITEDPEMSTSPGHLESGFDPVLLQFQLQSREVTVGSRVIRVDRYPLRPLRLRVDGIKTNRLCA